MCLSRRVDMIDNMDYYRWIYVCITVTARTSGTVRACAADNGKTTRDTHGDTVGFNPPSFALSYACARPPRSPPPQSASADDDYCRMAR